jgi:hypothetical protein
VQENNKVPGNTSKMAVNNFINAVERLYSSLN